MIEANKITDERSAAIASLFVAFVRIQPIWKAEKDIQRFIEENLLEPTNEEQT